jgi:hypothetical protein
MNKEEVEAYRVLASFGLPLNFSEIDLTKAYRKAMKQYHPEQGNTSNDDMCIKINNAKAILNNSLSTNKPNFNQELMAWQKFIKIIEEFVPRLEFANIHVNPALQYEIDNGQKQIIKIIDMYKDKASIYYKQHDLIGLDTTLKNFYDENGHFINGFIGSYLNRWYATSGNNTNSEYINSIMAYIANYDIKQMTLEEVIKLINDKIKEQDNHLIDLNGFKTDLIASLRVKYDNNISQDTNEFLKRITVHYIDKANAILHETYMEINVSKDKDTINRYVKEVFEQNYWENIKDFTREYLYSWNQITGSLKDSDFNLLLQEILKELPKNVNFNKAKEIINVNIFRVSRQPLTVIKDTIMNIRRNVQKSPYYKVFGPQMDIIIDKNYQDIYNIYQTSLKGLSADELNSEIKAMKAKINKSINSLIGHYYQDNDPEVKKEEVYYLADKKVIQTEEQLKSFLDCIAHPNDFKQYFDLVKKLDITYKTVLKKAIVKKYRLFQIKNNIKKTIITSEIFNSLISIIDNYVLTLKDMDFLENLNFFNIEEIIEFVDKHPLSQEDNQAFAKR